MLISRNSALIAANINRFKEGGRVLEDIARFTLKDLELFRCIKRLKKSLNSKPLEIIDKGDIGGDKFIEHNKRVNLLEVVSANACRMQESARLLEEFTGDHFYKEIRFKTYAIHHEMVNKIKIITKMHQLRGIYPICDPRFHDSLHMAQIINQSEIKLCQLRMKGADRDLIYQSAKLFKSYLRDDVLLIINDHVDIALLCANGVHVGQNDLPVTEIRQIAPDDFIIGVSCHNSQEALKARDEGASYICVGALFPSLTKKDATPTSLHTLKEIIALTDLPIGVIGGINPTTAQSLRSLPIDMYAVQSALWGDADPLEVLEAFNAASTALMTR